jgi:hypothetical protein
MRLERLGDVSREPEPTDGYSPTLRPVRASFLPAMKAQSAAGKSTPLE